MIDLPRVVQIAVAMQQLPAKLPWGQSVVNTHNMQPQDAAIERVLTACGLSRRESAVLVLDLVGSVRRIAHDEARSVAQWVDFAQRLTSQTLPAHGGRVVKSRGDGLMVEFPDLRGAVAAAFAVQKLAGSFTDPEPLRLHMGLDSGPVLAGADDLYGQKVNIAAILADSAPANLIVVSQGVRDALADGVDALFEELEPVRLKGTAEITRRFALELGEMPTMRSGSARGSDILPTIAVVPLSEPDSGSGLPGLGDIICEDLLRHLGPLGRAHMISRRSTAAFRHRTAHPALVAARLDADYIVTGSCRRDGVRVDVKLFLYDARQGKTVWERVWNVGLPQLLHGSGSAVHEIAGALVAHIMDAAASAALSQVSGHAADLPTLESHTLLLGAMTLMNRQRREEFFLARTMLDVLVARAPRHSLPRAWLAQWLNLSIQQGWSADVATDGQLALDACQAALDIDPGSAVALAVRGLILTTVRHDTDVAASLFDTALRSDPNEPLAWLFHAANRMFAGEGEMALGAARRGIYLTPFDPALYLFQTIEASSAFVAGNDALALQLSQRAIRSNRQHVSSLRVRTAALWRLGRGDEARKSAAALLALEPGLTVERWRRRSPASASVSNRFAEALRGAGIPQD